MRIEFVKVDITEFSNAKGNTYKVAEVAYKDNGKINGKKVVSFGKSAPAFVTISTAKTGDVFEVTQVKDDKYWVWTALTPVSAGEVAMSTNSVKGATASPRSTYETPEERAHRQLLIVKQSSLTGALKFLELNGAKKFPIEELFDVAKQLEDWVFERKTGMAAVVEMQDDLPI